MKALPNLIVLLVLLLSMPILVYYMYTKTYISEIIEKDPATKNPSTNAAIQIKNDEITRLKKENTELKARKSNPLAQPPRPFGRGEYFTYPNSKGALSQPPRRVGRSYYYDYSYR